MWMKPFLYLSTSLSHLLEERRFSKFDFFSNSHLRVFICEVCILSEYYKSLFRVSNVMYSLLVLPAVAYQFQTQYSE